MLTQGGIHNYTKQFGRAQFGKGGFQSLLVTLLTQGFTKSVLLLTPTQFGRGGLQSILVTLLTGGVYKVITPYPNDITTLSQAYNGNLFEIFYSHFIINIGGRHQRISPPTVIHLDTTRLTKGPRP